MKRGLNKWLVILLIFCSGTFLSVNAQNNVDLDELLNGHVHKVDELLYSNLTFIQQTGDENQVKAIQEQEGILSNFVEVEQLNRGNSAYIDQKGSGHGAMLIQKGIGNEANLWSEGNLTVAKAIQFGDGNLINSYINNRNSLPKGALLVQEGNNNRIDFALLGNNDNLDESLTQAVSIRQTGNELEVNAVFESVETPVYIEQKSGPGGGGMKVDVSTSDFYFPMKR